METISLIGMLIICSIEDVREKRINTKIVAVFAIAGIVMEVINRSNDLLSIVGAVSIGLVLFLVSIFSKEKIGKGDALIVAVIGIYMGFTRTFLILWFGSIIAAVYGMSLILAKRKSKASEIAYVPFLMIASVCIMMAERLGGLVI